MSENKSTIMKELDAIKKEPCPRCHTVSDCTARRDGGNWYLCRSCLASFFVKKHNELETLQRINWYLCQKRLVNFFNFFVRKRNKPEMLQRTCAVCGTELTITVNKDKSYSGGHYFGELDINGKKSEYWECDKCYNNWPDEESDEVWQELSTYECLILVDGIGRHEPSAKDLSIATKKMEHVIEVGDRWALIKLCNFAIRHFHDHDHVTFGDD